MADQPHISMKPGFSMQEHLKLHSNLDDYVEFTTADISKLKEEGNAKLKAGDHQGAIEAYSRGICIFQENGSQVPAGMTGRDIAALYGNRAAVFLSQNKFQEALDDSMKSVSYDGHWYKGHARVGRAHRKLGNLEISFRALLDALKCTKTQSNDIKLEIIMELTQTYSMLPRNKFPLEAKIPETPITYELLWYRAAYSFIEKDCWDEAHVAYLQACTNIPMEAKFPVSLKPLCEIEKAELHPWVLQIIHYFLICHSNHQEISCYPGDTYFHAVAYLTIKAGSSKNQRSLYLLQYILDTFVLPKNEEDLLDKDGNTALHVVLREPCQDNKLRYDIMMLLAKAPVNPYIKNLEGKTVQDVAYNIQSLKVNLLFIEEVPQNGTSSFAKENIRENSIQEERIDLAARKITQVVKCSTNRETQKKKLEEMIRLLEDSKLSVYDLNGVQVTESGESTNPLNREKNKEGGQQKSDNTADTDDMKAEENEEVVIDAKVFDDLVWEIQCTVDVWKKLLDKHMPQSIKTRIIKKIHLLANGEWLPHLCKQLKVSPKLQLYEAKVSKGGRILWDVATTFSPRYNKTAEQQQEGEDSVSGGKIYSEIIRVWDIELDHDKLYRSVQRSVERIKFHNQSVPKKRLEISSNQTPTNTKYRIPKLFREVEENINLQQQKQQKYLPTASRNEHHVTKFYPFNSPLVSYVLRNIDIKADFPFCVTEKEQFIITLRSNAPVLLLGRSGTGKTICCLYRMLSQFVSYWKMAAEPLLKHTVDNLKKEEDLRGDKDFTDDVTVSDTDDKAKDNSRSQQAQFHQIFVTKNAVLCSEVQKNFHELSHGCDIIQNHVEREADNLPSRLQDVDECLFPLILTSRQLLLMLDASIGASYFFERNEDGSLKVDIQGRSEDDVFLRRLPLSDEDSDVEENETYADWDNDMDNKAKETSAARTCPKQLDPKREVTYKIFVDEVWPQILKKMKVRHHPSLVWTEIMSFIKGSFQALSKPCGYLSKEEYKGLGRKIAPNSTGERDNIYKYFSCYDQIKKQKNLFDETDLIHDIYNRLQNLQVVPWVIHQIYVDETQDFTQAELYLLIQICQNPNQMFLTGDTAQSIMRGISFRFEDLKALFFHARQSMQDKGKTEAIEVPKYVYQLTHSYRSHARILSLASSVLDLLGEFFPESFDPLEKDQGLFNGPQPVLLESWSISDLHVLLYGNYSKTSHIEFGAHQVILVVNDASRDMIPEELRLGLILTIYEAKGLEFDDVLLFNFFKDSQASKEWRLVTSYLEKLLSSQKASHQRTSSTTNEYLVEIDTDLMQQERSRPLTFDYNQHKVLNSELKHLYTALTRARVNLWIFDEDVEKRTPMFEYFKAKNLVRCLTLDETDKLKLINTVFAEGSSADDWKCRGSYFMKHSLYEAAAKCFEVSGETSNQKAALAHHIALAAGKMRGKPQDMKEEFLKAAKLFLECNLPTKAAICLQNAREQELAAQLYKNIGQFEKAAKIYYKLNNASESSRCLEISGNFNLAIQVLCKSENYDSAIDSLRRYAVKRKEFESRGDQIPQILIDCDPFKNFSEEYINIMLADFHHRHNNHNKMMLSLERLPCWKDRVEFLKEKGHVDEAIQILEENGG